MGFLWGLKGQELIDAMTSGGTYDDWAYLEEMERKQCGFDDDYYDEPSVKKNTMVFIDGGREKRIKSITRLFEMPKRYATKIKV